ncbi:hypothetical protein BKA70DRAFT_1124772 [Coprinopsis sp. MPI-PUGE-AT-0042]|nr:hypothetical protein BKA70DRAFT_1127735 [Coprinopsis sp. MPI-PUGE-AT-0042]KAH6884671.1 hypothetical protein BKA70DRAFT_1124772 [Coprinopsis sp. MPI-PUGE-AT-0042]
MHTSRTLLELRAATKRLGKALRTFVLDTCSQFETKDLPREAEARGRRRAKAKATSTSKGKQKEEPPEEYTRSFNMATYKTHALGHHYESACDIGPSDNVDTTVVLQGEREHRQVKAIFFPAASKTDFTEGVGKHYLRHRTMHLLTRARDPAPRLTANLEAPYEMSNDGSTRILLPNWLRENQNDPAIKASPLLHSKAHLLGRILGRAYDGDEDGNFSPEQLRQVVFINDTIYQHQRLRINYTTYDCRRAQDMLGLSSDQQKTSETDAEKRPFIMLEAHEPPPKPGEPEPHPYWYAEIIGIFHAKILYNDPATFNPETKSMDFLWIRWLGPRETYTSGWKAQKLHRVSYVTPREDSPMFGFLDPANVIRAVNLMPVDRYGRSTCGLGPSIARPNIDDDMDWAYYDVGMFADRDLAMRFRGGGVGHQATREATDKFLRDRDAVDLEFESDPEEGDDVDLLERLLTHEMDIEEIDDEDEVDDILEDEGIDIRVFVSLEGDDSDEDEEAEDEDMNREEDDY